MGKSKRSMNPADALRKKQRKRELKKNKEDRKRARETVLAKKDIDKVKQDISRLEHLAGSGQLDKNGQTRLDTLRGELGKIEKAKKAVGLTGAQAAFAARMQEHDKKHEGDSRKLVFDPKRGAFVPAKKKDTKQTTSGQQGENEEEGSSSNSSSESDSDLDSDSDSEKESGSEDESEIEGDVPPPSAEKEEKQPREITESDDEYEIPLPPGPPPPRPFAEQFIPMQAMQAMQPNMVRPPPPPPGVPVYRGAYGVPPPPPPPSTAQFGQRMPPPPPPIYYGYHPQQQQHPPPPPPIIRPPQHHINRPSTSYTAPVTYPNKEIAQTEKSSKPAPTVATISAEPQLRDLQKELLGFVPAALRRKQASAQKKAALPKGARPNINAAPTIDDEDEDNDYNE